MKIMSLNTRGLNNDMKRKKIYLWIKKQCVDVALLQETYCTKKNLDKIKKDWDGKSFFGLSNSSHSRGVSILFRKSIDVEIVDHYTKDDGRAILINAIVNDEIITLVNVYCPNSEKDKSNFFEQITEWIQINSASMDNLIVAGDFNTCLLDNDRTTKTHLKDKSRKILKTVLTNLNIEDMWNRYSIQKDQYTWKDAKSQSRLDYFFCSKECNFEVKMISTKVVISSEIGNRLTDHKAVMLDIAFIAPKRGPGYWKLNTEVLTNDQYKKELEQVIGAYINNNETTSSQEQWEMIKIKIREFTIKESKRICKEKKDRIKLLEQHIERESNQKIIYEKQHELQKMYAEEVVGAQIRSKADIVDDLEFNTKLFKSMEKSKQARNAINVLRNENKEEVTNQGDILKSMTDFYNKLYGTVNSQNEDIDDYLANIDIEEKLDVSQQESLEKEPTIEEIETAMDKIKEKKSPGIDGIPIELYKTFWQLLKTPYTDMVKECFNKGILPVTTRTSVLSLIYKKGDKKELKNYRPLSLSNTDYKIIATVMSERLHRVIDKLVSYDQSGYIRGRNITTSVRQILDIYEHCEHTNSPGAILCIDFEKAFDSMEHEFLYKVLKKYNFGKKFISWIKLLYTEPRFKIKNNGWLSQDCIMNRGVRQGCSMSALLFILAVEILSKSIKQTKKLDGIKIGDTEHKIVQYADDSTIFLRSIKSIEHVMEIFDAFGKVSGLRLNKSKTKGIWIGKLKDEGLRICHGLHFTGNPVKCLGLFIGHNKEKTENLNWDKRLDSIEKTVSYWNKMKLSLFAKIKVIKTYVMSKITFVASLIEVPEKVIAKLKSICYNYLWGGKRDKVKRTTVIGKINEGGLNMIDINAYLMSLKASWASKILKLDGIWKNVFQHHVRNLGIDVPYLFKMNFTEVKLFKVLMKLPKFYIEVLTAYNKCKTLPDYKLLNSYQLLTQPIWGNLFFQINGECLYFNAWVKSNILYVKDLINDNGLVKTEDEIYDQVEDKRKIIQELYLIKKCVINKIRNKELTNAKYTKISNNISILHQNKNHNVILKKSKFYYDCLKQNNISRGNMESIWSRVFKFNNSKFVWNKIYQQKIIELDIAKVSEFNFKVLHNILPCGKVLSKWLKNCTENCLDCGQIETTEHMLFGCQRLEDIWESISDIIKVNIKWKNIVCGLPSSDDSKNVRFINLLISMVSYSIFKCSNKRRWAEDQIQCNVNQMIVRDIIFYKLLMKRKKDNILEDVRVKRIVETLI